MSTFNDCNLNVCVHIHELNHVLQKCDVIDVKVCMLDHVAALFLPPHVQPLTDAEAKRSTLLVFACLFQPFYDEIKTSFSLFTDAVA